MEHNNARLSVSWAHCIHTAAQTHSASGHGSLVSQTADASHLIGYQAQLSGWHIPDTYRGLMCVILPEKPHLSFERLDFRAWCVVGVAEVLLHI